MTIAIIAGARPNFIKAAPLYKALIAGADVRIIHTGQHRDAGMSEVFFSELGLPKPWALLKGRRQTIPQEMARITAGLESPLNRLRPDWVIVIGDITSTLAGAIAAKQSGLRLAHVEAGLRSHDRSMPEELNRIVVDHLADELFVSEEAGQENLIREGIAASRIHFTGNVLIDALQSVLKGERAVSLEHKTASRKAFPEGQYVVFTFHRPSNVDHETGLRRIIRLVEQTAERLPVYFPVHPRTVRQLEKNQLLGRLKKNPAVHLLPPQQYSAMAHLMANSVAVITDSGGIQEETTCLGVPCLTFRNTTERPSTIIYGTNTLIEDRNTSTALHQIELILSGRYKSGRIPPLWDGRAAIRIAEILLGKT